MNKSWKSFDLLLTTPSPTRTSRTFPRGTTVPSTSTRRIIAELKPNTSPRSSSTLQPIQLNASGDTTLIENDLSDDDDSERSTVKSVAISSSAVDCSAPSLDPKDVAIWEKSRPDSDIENLSEPQAPANDDPPLEISETSSDDSDCEAIHCKKEKRLKLDFLNHKSPGRRITDDIFTVENATELTISTELSSKWIKPIVTENSLSSKGTPMRKPSSTWKRLDESFRDNQPTTTAKSPPSCKWKTLNDTFRKNPAEIESDLTPENVPLPKTNEPSIQQDADTSFYDPTLQDQWPSRVKYRKGCPLSRFNQALQETAGLARFWLHEREMDLIPAYRKPVKIQTIGRIFGRIVITYHEPIQDEPGAVVEHILYVDPSEKQLKPLRKGSLIEVMYDLVPHNLTGRRVVHLGVSKIRAVS